LIPFQTKEQSLTVLWQLTNSVRKEASFSNWENFCKTASATFQIIEDYRILDFSITDIAIEAKSFLNTFRA